MLSKISRGLFLASIFFVVICSDAGPALAWYKGSAGITFGQSVLNFDFSADDLYLNITKGLSVSLGTNTPANLTEDQYPANGALAGTYSGVVGVPAFVGYYGHQTLSWSGTCAFSIASSVPTLVYSGGAAVFNVGTNTGAYFGAPTFIQNANTNVEFSFGTLISAVGTNGGNVQLTSSVSTGTFEFAPGTHVKFFNGVSSNLLTGPNSDGSWTILSQDGASNNMVTLANSSSIAGSVTVTGTGGVGTQTEMIMDISTIAGSQLSVNFPQSIPGIGTVTYSGCSNLVWGKTTDIATLVATGHQIKQPVIDFVKAYKPKYLRLMDYLAAQGWYANFSQMGASTALTYSPVRWSPSLYAGSTAGTGDNYTVTNSSSGAYQDGETVQFLTNRATTGAKPTLQVNSRGAAPLIPSNSGPFFLDLTGSVTTGDVISVVFTGQFSYTFTYTVLSSDNSINVLGNSFSTAINSDPTLLANGFNCGNAGFGVLPCDYVTGNGQLTATSSTSGSGTEICTPGTFNITGGAAFANATLYTAIYNKPLGAFIQGNTAGSFGLGGGSPLSVPAEVATRGNVGLWLSFPLIFTQASWQSAGSWAATNLPGLPVSGEVANEVWNFAASPTTTASALGNALGFVPGDPFDHLADNPFNAYYGLLTAQMLPAFASSYVGAGGSRSNLQLLSMDTIADGDGGYSNHQMICCRWNGQQLTPTPATFTGTISGGTTLTVASINSTGFVWPSLTIAGSCVTAGTKIVQQTSGTGRGNGVYTITPSNTNGSCAMTASNPAYSAVGGPDGGSATTSFNAFPTRPIDFMDGIGFATYWGGALANQGASSWSGTQSFYNTLFQASSNFAAGGSTNITNALNAWDADLNTGTKNGSCIGSNGCDTICNFLQGDYTTSCPTANTGGELRAYETDAQLYDSQRAGAGIAKLSVYLYEGSIQQSLAANAFNGTSSATSPGELNSQFTANGWTLSPTFGASNLVVATNIVNLQIAYYNSTQFFNTQLNFWNAMKAIFSDRPNFAPAQFGIGGPQTSAAVPQLPLWGIFSGNISTTILQNGAAQEFYNNN